MESWSPHGGFSLLPNPWSTLSPSCRSLAPRFMPWIRDAVDRLSGPDAVRRMSGPAATALSPPPPPPPIIASGQSVGLGSHQSHHPDIAGPPSGGYHRQLLPHDGVILVPCCGPGEICMYLNQVGETSHCHTFHTCCCAKISTCYLITLSLLPADLLLTQSV